MEDAAAIEDRVRGLVGIGVTLGNMRFEVLQLSVQLSQDLRPAWRGNDLGGRKAMKEPVASSQPMSPMDCPRRIPAPLTEGMRWRLGTLGRHRQ